MAECAIFRLTRVAQVVRAALEDNTTLVCVDVRGNKIAKELEASIRGATSNNALHAQQRLLMKKGANVKKE